jgi:hypothetical protein
VVPLVGDAGMTRLENGGMCADMDSARQALRWSIPGLIFVLELAVFGAVWQLVSGENPSLVVADIAPTTALLTIFAGIPIGFLLYQFYYRNYRSYGRSVLLFIRFPHAVRNWTFVRRDRGAEILRRYFEMGGHPNLVRRSWDRDPTPIGIDDEQIREVTMRRELLPIRRQSSFKVLTLGEALHDACQAPEPIVCRDCRAVYMRRFRWNWAVIMAMLDYVSSRSDGAAIKLEYAAGSDIYHALGAARTAIATSAVGSIGYQLVFHLLVGGPIGADAGVRFLVGAFVVAALAYAQYQVIHSAREQSSTNLAIRTAAALAWYSRLPDVRNARTLPRTRTNGKAAQV